LESQASDRAAWRKPVAVLGLVYSVWALVGTGAQALLWGAGLLVAGVPVYVLMRYRKAAAAKVVP
jgi:APA family basic amino acid/polyamine antiporter